MKHHQYKPNFHLVKEPVEFNKYTDKTLLQYCLGATLYMPATKDIIGAIKNKKLPGLTSMVMCFEDAIEEDELPDAENNVISFLDNIHSAMDSGSLNYEDIPLFFLRIRNPVQFKYFAEKLLDRHIKLITGFVFPKFTSSNGYLYLNYLESLNSNLNEVLYGMPILESKAIALKETRTYELTAVRNLLKPYQDLILNIRVGATDFSSIFGVRRGINYTIYDIMTVRDCLSDILNFLNREDEDYVVSAPVWEYFFIDKDAKLDYFKDKKATFVEAVGGNIQSSLLKRNLIVNEAIDGLLREVILDKANGFVGKTIIHPTHLKYVNAMQAVTKEEYEDAVQILEASGGVVKGANNNKMNEISRHYSWANKTYKRALAYGVVQDESSYSKLFL